MEPDELRALMSKTADLMESYQRNCEGMAQRQQAELQVMRGLSQQIPAVVQQETSSSMHELRGQVIGEVRAGLEQPAREHTQLLRAVGGELVSNTQGLSQTVVNLQHAAKLIMWKLVGTVMGVLLLLLLLLAGAIWLSMHYVQVIEENQVSAELMKAYNRADVTLCGNGRLCANVGTSTKGQRYGDHRQYAPVMER